MKAHDTKPAGIGIAVVLVATLLGGRSLGDSGGPVSIVVVVSTTPTNDSQVWSQMRGAANVFYKDLEPGENIRIITADASGPRLRLEATKQADDDDQPVMAHLWDEVVSPAAAHPTNLLAALDAARVEPNPTRTSHGRTMLVLLMNGRGDQVQAEAIWARARELHDRDQVLYLIGTRDTHPLLLAAAAAGLIKFSLLSECDPGAWVVQFRSKDKSSQAAAPPPPTLPTPPPSQDSVAPDSGRPHVGNTDTTPIRPNLTTPPPQFNDPPKPSTPPADPPPAQTPAAPHRGIFDDDPGQPWGGSPPDLTPNLPESPNMPPDAHRASSPPSAAESPPPRHPDPAGPTKWRRFLLPIGGIAAGVIMVLCVVGGGLQWRRLYGLHARVEGPELVSPTPPTHERSLQVIYGGQHQNLGQVRKLTSAHIGSGAGNTIRIHHPKVAERHACLCCKHAEPWLQNLSRAPIRVNDQPLERKKCIRLDLPARILLADDVELRVELS